MFPDRVIASGSSPIPEDIWITFNSDCCGDNFQILSVLRPPPTHPRGYIGFSLCFGSRFVLSVVFSVGSDIVVGLC